MSLTSRFADFGEPSTRLMEERVNRPRNLTLAVMFVILAAAFSNASDIYIAQNAAGGNTGADCADAHAVSWFNSSSSWGSAAGQIGPGTTVHLCGTFNAPAGASGYLTFQGSGANGNPITLLFENGAVLTAPYWGGAAIQLGNNSYLTINGGMSGIIQATANGTGLANSQDGGLGINTTGTVSNITIENLTISNLYKHTCTESVSNCTDQGGQNTYGIRLLVGSNIVINNNTVHDMKWAIFLAYGYGGTTSTSLDVYNNTVYDMDHGVVYGDAGTNSVLKSTNCSSAIYNNDFSAMQPWDAAGDVNHHDATHLWANNAASGSSYSGVCVYSNYFHGDAGATDNTIFGMESYGNGNYTFNNIINVDGSSACATGAMGFWTGSGNRGAAQHAFNNTISPTSNCSNSVNYEQNSGGVFENNLILSSNPTYVYTDGTSGTLTTVDYNSYATVAGPNPFYGPSGCPSGASFATWKSGCGFDTHGQNVSITVNAAPFTLPSGSAAVGAATNLTSLGITALNTGAPQTFGVGGSCGTGCVARASSGVWDAGAYPYSTGGQAPPQAPTNLAATVH
jgi:hypothetical protein